MTFQVLPSTTSPTRVHRGRSRGAEKLRKLVAKKRASKKNVVHVEVPEREEGKVVDLLEVLKKSLAGKRKAA